MSSITLTFPVLTPLEMTPTASIKRGIIIFLYSLTNRTDTRRNKFPTARRALLLTWRHPINNVNVIKGTVYLVIVFTSFHCYFQEKLIHLRRTKVFTIASECNLIEIMILMYWFSYENPANESARFASDQAALIRTARAVLLIAEATACEASNIKGMS